MATTTYGTEYVQSSDLVSNWPGSSLSVANRIDDVSLKGNGLNDQTGTSYTLVLTDGGKTVTANNAAAVTFTIPTNASVAFPTGTVIGFTNKGAGTLTLAGAGGVTVNGSKLSFAQHESGTALKLDTNTWVVAGGALGKASYSSTTGSPTVTTVGGKTCVQFTGSGSITISQAGLVEVLVIGGGGAGGADNGGGGGAGGYYANSAVYLDASTHTVISGAGAPGGTQTQYQGNPGSGSRVGPYFALGGGGGGSNAQTYLISGTNGGSGGGSTRATTAGGTGMSGQGNNGGAGAATFGGGGGGSGGVGADGGTTGAGGAGTASSITGSSVTRAAGGASDRVNGNTAVNGGANTGTGGGGVDSGVTTAGNGGSGIVILLFG
jgi:hypothetical protein